MNIDNNKIDERILKLKKESNHLSLFFNILESYNPIIIGGFIRDVINDKDSRDIDIILNTDNINIINDTICNFDLEYIKNAFDGYKIYIDNTTFDVWNICNHNMFKKGIYKANVDNLKNTTFINYDSLIYDINNKNLDIDNYLNYLNSNTIEFVGNSDAILSNPNPYLSIVKIFSISYYNNSIISSDIRDYILTCYNSNKNNFFLNLNSEYERHYGVSIPDDLNSFIYSYLKDRKVKKLT